MCLEGILKISGRCPEYALKNLECVCLVLEMYLKGVLEVICKGLEKGWKISEKSLEGFENVF